MSPTTQATTMWPEAPQVKRVKKRRGGSLSPVGVHASEAPDLSDTQNVMCWKCGVIRPSQEFTRQAGEAGRVCIGCRNLEAGPTFKPLTLAEAAALDGEVSR